jgi:ubiquinone/menaquinone biosynthesis C-methylase UbiE
MSWDPVWEEYFRARDLARYPLEDFIRFMAVRYFGAPDRGQVKVLDAGCGTGAHVWFLAREGFDVSGIDGSETAIQKARRRLDAEGLKADLKVGDVVALTKVFPKQHFDVVTTTGCLQCNRLSAVHTILDEIKAVLKPGGRVFATLVSVGSHGHGLGKEVEPNTFVDIAEGGMKGAGLNHFFSQQEVEDLFGKRFHGVQLGYFMRSLDNRSYYKHWVVEGEKPA